MHARNRAADVFGMDEETLFADTDLRTWAEEIAEAVRAGQAQPRASVWAARDAREGRQYVVVAPTKAGAARTLRDSILDEVEGTEGAEAPSVSTVYGWLRKA